MLNCKKYCHKRGKMSLFEFFLNICPEKVWWYYKML